MARTDVARTIISTTLYAPYGEVVETPIKLDDPVNGIGYTGHVLDTATDLVYMQQRYYDPAIGRFLSVDPVGASTADGTNFNRYWYANNNPYRFTDPDGRLSRGSGFTDRQWKRFDRAQQSAAKSLEKSAARIDRALATGKGMKGVVRNFERNFGSGSATPQNLAQVSSDMSTMAAALRDTGPSAIPANGMTAAAMTAAYGNMKSSVLAGVPTTGPVQVVVNLDHVGFRSRSTLAWGLGHETGHAALGYKDQKVNGVPAYKFGTPQQQQIFETLPTSQRLVNPDHLMDQAR